MKGIINRSNHMKILNILLFNVILNTSCILLLSIKIIIIVKFQTLVIISQARILKYLFISLKIIIKTQANYLV